MTRRRLRLDVTPMGPQVGDRAAQPHATSNARILHRCGHYVYTERHDRKAPAFPTVCPHCGEAMAT